jgi:hypothetical protein
VKSPAFFIRKSEIRCPARERTADMNNPNLNIQNVNEDEMREVGRKIKEARKGMREEYIRQNP